MEELERKSLKMLRIQQQRPSSGGSEAELDAMGKSVSHETRNSIYYDLAREDLAVLQRKLRVSEGNKKSYADQAHNVLRKQV